LVDFQGLEIADVKNYDARIEWYPTDDSMFAAGVFYKKVGNPIERIEVFGQDSDLPVFTFINNENTADLFGIELEMRQNLGALIGREFWEFLSFGGNFTYIDAKVDRSGPELTTAELAGFPRESFSDDRPLYDQPDIIGNFYINLIFEKIGADLTLSGNYTGERLNAAAGSSTSDIFDEPVTTLNLVYQQDVPGIEGLSVKLTAKNITDPTFSRATKREDNDAGLLDESGAPIKERDLESYKKGVDYSISLNYSF
jgi:outer membrane receptor protein involved in Fe transport